MHVMAGAEKGSEIRVGWRWLIVMCPLHPERLCEHPLTRLCQQSQQLWVPSKGGNKDWGFFWKISLSGDIVRHSFFDKGLIICLCDFALGFDAGSANESIFKQILLPRQL